MEIYLKSFRLIKSLSNKPYITLYYTEGKKKSQALFFWTEGSF